MPGGRAVAGRGPISVIVVSGEAVGAGVDCTRNRTADNGGEALTLCVLRDAPCGAPQDEENSSWH
jgi:hypothetical protein